MSNNDADLRVPAQPDGTCQCNPSPGHGCSRLATQEDLLCDQCRMVRKDKDLICFTFWYQNVRADSGEHGYCAAKFSWDDAPKTVPGSLTVFHGDTDA
jgi:hypothetical protein